MITLTVVTVNFNSGDLLFSTIKSIKRFKDTIKIKHVIIDGGSSDISQEDMKNYLDEQDIYVSEPDGGIYDAMNKAFKYITEETYLTWINSGDTLINADLTFDILRRDTPDCLVCSTVELRHLDSEYTNRIPEKIDVFNEKNFMDFRIHHQGFIIKSSLIKKHYDVSIGAMSDKLFMIQNLENLNMIHYSSVPHCCYITGGLSDKPSLARIVSHYSVSRKLELNIIQVIASSPIKTLRFLLRNIFPYFLFNMIRKYIV